MKITPGLLIEMLQVYALPNAERNKALLLDLLTLRLVVYSEGKIEVTEKGKVWIEMLCQTPLPVQLWVDPRSEAAK